MGLLASALGTNQPLPPGLPRIFSAQALDQAVCGARFHGLELYLLTALEGLQRTGVLEFDPAAAKALEERRRLSLRRSLMWDPVLDEVLGLVDPGGRRGVLVLKGGGLRHLLYPQPALRELSDLDLLLPPEGMEEAEAALVEAGWQREGDPHWHARHLRRDLGGFSVMVELHRSLDQVERCGLTHGDLVGQSVLVEGPGFQLRVPGLAHQALVALVHARKHGLEVPLKNLLDYHLVQVALARQGGAVAGGPEWQVGGLPATRFVLDEVCRAWFGEHPSVDLPLASLGGLHRRGLAVLLDPWRHGYLRGVPRHGVRRYLAVQPLLLGSATGSAREFAVWVRRRANKLVAGGISSGPR
jgi:hypothetical protein